MRPHLIIAIFTFLTVAPVIMGWNSWPLFAYRMYSNSNPPPMLYYLEGETDDGHIFIVRNAKTLFPIGHNGMNEKIIRILRDKEKEHRLAVFLKFYYGRTKTTTPNLKTISIVQRLPYKNDQSSSEKYPMRIHTYP